MYKINFLLLLINTFRLTYAMNSIWMKIENNDHQMMHYYTTLYYSILPLVVGRGYHVDTFPRIIPFDPKREYTVYIYIFYTINYGNINI